MTIQMLIFFNVAKPGNSISGKYACVYLFMQVYMWTCICMLLGLKPKTLCMQSQ